jgi:hypothetical protein
MDGGFALGPTTEQRKDLDPEFIPGVDTRAAEMLVAEIGPDMSRPPTRTSPPGAGYAPANAIGGQEPLRRNPQGLQGCAAP